MERQEYDRMRALEETHWWFRARRRIVASVVERVRPKDRAGEPLRVLDFGCGCGGNTAYFDALATMDVHGVDVCSEAIEYCRERGLKSLEVIPFEGWKPENGAFDVVLALDVLEHIDDDTAALEAIWNGLRPGGVLVMSVPAFHFLWSGHDVALHHFRRHTRASLDALAARTSLGRWTHRTYYNCWLFPPVAAIRLSRRMFDSSTPKYPGTGRDASVDDATNDGHVVSEYQSDTTEAPAGPMNALLEAVFASERALVGRVPLPFGVSLIAWARKGDDGSAVH